MSTWSGETKFYSTPVSRRALLKTVIGGTLLVAAGATGLTQVEPFLKTISPKRPADKFLDLVDGKPVITEKPVVVEVSYSPVESNSPFVDKVNVTVRRTSSDQSKELQVKPESLPQYAVRVFGHGYRGENPSHQVTVEYDGASQHGGIWFLITDRQGNPIKPDGRPIDQNEDPYYVAGNFVTVQQQQK